MADACLTGVGASLVVANTNLRFSATEAYEVVRVSGFGRSVIVLDDSHLGLEKNGPMEYCPGDLVELRDGTLEVKNDPDNTDRFRAGTDGSTAMSIPIPLGVASGTANRFTLTLPKEVGTATAATFSFSGFWNDDSGFELSMRDRIRSTYRCQPDGKKMIFTAYSSVP